MLRILWTNLYCSISQIISSQSNFIPKDFLGGLAMCRNVKQCAETSSIKAIPKGLEGKNLAFPYANSKQVCQYTCRREIQIKEINEKEK